MGGMDGWVDSTTHFKQKDHLYASASFSRLQLFTWLKIAIICLTTVLGLLTKLTLGKKRTKKSIPGRGIRRWQVWETKRWAVRLDFTEHVLMNMVHDESESWAGGYRKSSGKPLKGLGRGTTDQSFSIKGPSECSMGKVEPGKPFKKLLQLNKKWWQLELGFCMWMERSRQSLEMLSI